MAIAYFQPEPQPGDVTAPLNMTKWLFIRPTVRLPPCDRSLNAVKVSTILDSETCLENVLSVFF